MYILYLKLVGIILSIFLMVGIGQADGDPIPYLKINNSNGPATICQCDTVSVVVGLGPGDHSGTNVDWWAATLTPSGWYYYDYELGQWYPVGDSYLDLLPTYQGPLITLPPYPILNAAGSDLSTGTYTFYFGVDLNMNGWLDLGESTYQSQLMNVCDTPYCVTALNFGPYIGNQDPNSLPPPEIGEPQIRERLEILQCHTQWIRAYGCAHGLGRSGAIAHQLGMKAALGAWIGKDDQANQAEINCLINAAKGGDADMLIVGNEVLRQGYRTENQLIPKSCSRVPRMRWKR